MLHHPPNNRPPQPGRHRARKRKRKPFALASGRDLRWSRHPSRNFLLSASGTSRLRAVGLTLAGNQQHTRLAPHHHQMRLAMRCTLGSRGQPRSSRVTTMLLRHKREPVTAARGRPTGRRSLFAAKMRRCLPLLPPTSEPVRPFYKKLWPVSRWKVSALALFQSEASPGYAHRAQSSCRRVQPKRSASFGAA